MDKDTLFTVGINLARGVELTRLLRHLSAAGIEPLVLRGAALVETVYPHPGKRFAADIDLLLKPEEVPTVKHILAREGYSAPPDSTAPHYFKQGKLNYIYHLDLHWDIWYLKEDEFRNLWRDALTFNLNGIKAKTLAPEEHFIYVGMHSFFHHGKLDPIRLQDLVTLAKHTLGFDWSRLIDKARSYRLEVPMRVVLETVRKADPAVVPQEVFSHFGLKGSLAKIWAECLRWLIRHRPVLHIGHLLKISSIRGTWGKFWYLMGYLFPSGLFMKERYPLLRRYPFLKGWFYLQRPIALVARGLKGGIKYLLSRGK